MAEETKGQTLEMRVAALEDKLTGMNVTEEEMRAYQKVASLMGAQAGAAPGAGALAPAACVTQCVISACTVVHQCTIRACTIVQQCTIRACTVVQQCTVQQCTIRACTIEQCINECSGGLPGGPIGGGFGTLGG